MVMTYSNVEKGLTINFATWFKFISNHIFWIGGDDIEWSAPVIPYSSTTNKGGIKGDIFVLKGLVLKILVFHMHHDPKL